MASSHDHEPPTRADLANLARAVLQATSAQGDELQAGLVQARIEVRAEATQLAHGLRTEMSQLRLDLGTRLEQAALRLEQLIRHGHRRLLVVAVLAQLVVWAVVVAALAAPG